MGLRDVYEHDPEFLIFFIDLDHFLRDKILSLDFDLIFPAYTLHALLFHLIVVHS